MKYPVLQFEILVEILKQLSSNFNVLNVDPNRLHYIAYQQTAEGQKHNSLFKIDSFIKPYHSLNDIEKQKAVKLINVDFDFQLYPEGCNDNHIVTAVKKALKFITQ